LFLASRDASPRALMREANFRRYTNCEVASAVKPEDGLAFYRKYKEDWIALAQG